MSEQLTKEALALVARPVIGNLATIGASGYPQLTPLWVDHADGDILINTAEGRVKDRNMRRDPHVALSIVDPEDPYHVVAFAGTVTEITTDGADAHIDRLAGKYLGKEAYPFRRPGEVRLKVRIRPDHILAQPQAR